MHMRSVLLFLLLVLPVRLLAEPPPVELYAALPAAQDLRLSPDGEAVAMIAPVDDRPALLVRRNGKTAILALDNATPDWVEWKSPTRLLISARFTQFDAIDRPYVETRLIFIDADGGNVTPVKLENLIDGQRGAVPIQQDNVVSLLPHDPDHILLAVRPARSNDLHIIRVDIHTGRLAGTVMNSQISVVKWLADEDGVVRGEEQYGRVNNGAMTHQVVSARDKDSDDWQVVHQGEADQGGRFIPLAIDRNDLLYVLTDDGDKGRFSAHSIDLKTHKTSAPLIDSAGCGTTPTLHLGQLISLYVPCTDKTLYLDPDWQRDWQDIGKALGGQRVRIIDRTADGKRVLAVANRTIGAPDSFWLLDRRGAEPTLIPLGEAYRKLPQEQIADGKWISYQARDGLRIPAVLTMPLGKPDRPIAFVILPHGGPTANDQVRFDWMVQFFVGRGYGVLQPQFRGSTGNGAAFERAGYQQWGLAMQDDVTDGTRWLIDQKLVDPAHICIVGGSYGGYAALMGAIKEPTLYACAAAFAPVTDLDRLITEIKTGFYFRDLNFPKIAAEGQSLKAVSPVANADKIQVPLLLMHGRKDFTVSVEHSLAMEKELRRAGKKFEAIYLDNADHYFAAGSDRLAWLTALDKLLAAHLRGEVAVN
jgi:dipeptidyl aminopeptidase/acylaminoacyl peptidase